MAQTALIITDGKPGHENQSRALCEALGLPADTVCVTYGCGRKSLSYLFDWLGIRWPHLFRAAPPIGTIDAAGIRLVVGTGSTAYYPAKCMARRLNVPCVAILMPRGYRLTFDCIVVPEYDRPPERRSIVTVPVNVCPLDPGRYQRQAAEFAERHAQKRPAAGFILGGHNAVSNLDAADLHRQLRQAMEQLPDHEFWVTTSRRTPPEVDALINELPFDYRLVYSRDPNYNPTPAFVALCDRLFVTSDSASMISESVCFGSSAVEILMTHQRRADSKFLRLIRGLESRGAAHVFDGTLGDARAKIDLRARLEEVQRFV